MVITSLNILTFGYYIFKYYFHVDFFFQILFIIIQYGNIRHSAKYWWNLNKRPWVKAVVHFNSLNFTKSFSNCCPSLKTCRQYCSHIGHYGKIVCTIISIEYIYFPYSHHGRTHEMNHWVYPLLAIFFFFTTDS